MANLVLKELAVELAVLEAAIAALNGSKLADEVVHLVEDKVVEQEAFYQGVVTLFPKLDAKKIKMGDIPEAVTQAYNQIDLAKAAILIPPAAEGAPAPATTAPAPAKGARAKAKAKAAAKTTPKPAAKEAKEAPAKAETKKEEKEGTTVATKGKGKKETKKAAKKGGENDRLGFFPMVRDMLAKGESAEKCEAAVAKLFAKKYSDPKIVAKRAYRTVYRVQIKMAAEKKSGKNKKK